MCLELLLINACEALSQCTSASLLIQHLLPVKHAASDISLEQLLSCPHCCTTRNRRALSQPSSHALVVHAAMQVSFAALSAAREAAGDQPAAKASKRARTSASSNGASGTPALQLVCCLISLGCSDRAGLGSGFFGQQAASNCTQVQE